MVDSKRLSENCNFGATLEAMLGDRIVCGINEGNTQRRLFSWSDLAFKKTFEIAQGVEASRRYFIELSGESQSGGRKQEV